MVCISFICSLNYSHLSKSSWQDKWGNPCIFEVERLYFGNDLWNGLRLKILFRVAGFKKCVQRTDPFYFPFHLSSLLSFTGAIFNTIQAVGIISPPKMSHIEE